MDKRRRGDRDYYAMRSSDGPKTDRVTISLSRFYDISHMITQDMPVYPGEPEPQFRQISRLGKGKANVTKLILGSHTGTHTDAPSHFLSGTSVDAVDDIPIGRMIGKAAIVDMSSKGVGHGMTDSDFEGNKKHLISKTGGDIILAYTGTSERWEKNGKTRTNFSYLEPSGAQWLVDHRVKCIGIDSFSIEKYGFVEGLSHKKLLRNGVGIIEGLSSELKRFAGKRMFLVCVPLPLKGIDGSPVRPILFDIL
jgi:arylformamidase